MGLRPYQQQIVDETRMALAKYRRILIQSGTGSGKTRTAAEIARLASLKGRRVLIISNRTEIMSQNGGAFSEAGLSVEYVSPRSRALPKGSVCSAMAQTLKRRVEKSEWLEWLRSMDFVFIDECHTCDADFVHDLLREDCYVVGLTATPSRGGHQRQLGSMYKAMVVGISINELIGMEYLSPARHYSVAAPKLDDVDFNYSTGDYSAASMAPKFESKTHYFGLVDEWQRLAWDKKTVIFCVSSKQAISITQELCARGVDARYVLSGSFDEDEEYSGKRKEVLDAFAAGEFKVLVNVGMLVAGYDCPSIECVVLDFATVSITKYLQSIGRGSRICEGKSEFLVLDCGDNYRRHGLYNADRQWCLWHYEGSSDGMVTYKLCDPQKKNHDGRFGCGHMVPSPCKVCPNCGYRFDTDKDMYEMHLEEIRDTAEEKSIAKFCAEKKLEGWSLPRIMVQVCLANTLNVKGAFTEAYLALYPDKSEADAGKYWFFFKRRIWDNVKKKQLPLHDGKS